jgi:iron complex outermembrane receptor protein
MKKTIALFALFFTVIYSFAQSTIDFSGKITDEASKPVGGASVVLLNTNLGSVTDKNGQFSFSKIHTGTYQLHVTAIGYATVTREVNVSSGGAQTSIALTPSATRLDEVVVSAEKREELLQRLPLSVTALSSRQVREYRLWNIRELTAIVPTFYSSDPGDKRNVSSVRGITTTSYDPAIATYVDGVNQFNLDTYIPQLFDVERVEVLRGPQGTLYGRNAMGGVVNIITKQPTNQFSGFAEANVGSKGQQRYTAGIRLPIVKDKLFFGAAGMYERLKGFYTNDFNNSRFDKQHSLAGNFYLKYLPAANWAVTLNTKAVQNRNNGPFTLSYLNEFFVPFHVAQNAITKLMDNTLNSSLSVTHNGAGFNFTSQTSYQKNYRYYTNPIDGDFSPIDGITVINNYGKDWNNVSAWTQELRFSSPSNTSAPLQWTGGLYGFYQDNPTKQATRFGADAAMIDPSIQDKNFSLINTTKAKTKGVAVFGQATYSFTKQLELTAGLRYDYEHKEQSILGEYQHDPNPNPMFPYQPDTSASANFKAFSPKLSLAYHPVANNTLYATYSKGYRAGGLTPIAADPSQPPLYAFSPEKSNNYEVGYKATALDNKLRTNISVFYSEVNDAQVPTLVLPDAVTITKNAGKLTSKGVELELAANPLKGLELMYGVGYTRARYKTLKLSQYGNEVNLEGRRQIFTPDVTSMLAAQYSYLVNEAHHLQLFVRGEWKYLGNHYFDLSNSIKQSAYHTVNARAGLATKCMELAFWGRNLTDKEYISYAYDFGAAHMGDPRTYGVQLILRMN